MNTGWATQTEWWCMDERQLFDRPIEAYLADDNAFKWLRVVNARASNETVKDAALQSMANAEFEAIFNAIETAFQSWDPNHGQGKEETVRIELESKLKAISETMMSRLSDKQRRTVRTQQKLSLGYGTIFAVSPKELSLDERQQEKLAELSKQIHDMAKAATNKEMESIQIRNPQAYLGYKFCRFYEETRKLRTQFGKEFYDKSLSAGQRDQLQLRAPAEGMQVDDK